MNGVQQMPEEGPAPFSVSHIAPGDGYRYVFIKLEDMHVKGIAAGA